jgi:hypothetical protein
MSELFIGHSAPKSDFEFTMTDTVLPVAANRLLHPDVTAKAYVNVQGQNAIILTPA